MTVQSTTTMFDNGFAKLIVLVLLAVVIVAFEKTSLGQDVAHADAQAERLTRFQKLSSRGQELYFLGQDRAAAIMLHQALDEMGIWASESWWLKLPTSHLDADGQAAVRWEVYRTMLALNGIYLKRMGTALTASTNGIPPSSITVMKRFLTTELGRTEALAAVDLSRRIDSFRPSQANRWYSRTAAFRLGRGPILPAKELLEMQNAPDGQSLATLCLLSHHAPDFMIWFSDYGHFLATKDTPSVPLLNAMLSTTAQAAAEAPNHYWTQLCHAHSHYWTAERERKLGNIVKAIEHYELSFQVLQHCMNLEPQRPLAYCDGATALRQHALTVLANPERTAVEESEAEALLQKSLELALSGQTLGPDQPWVYWHLAACHASLGNAEEVESSVLAGLSQQSGWLEPQDFIQIRLEDLRGRAEVQKCIENWISVDGAKSRWLALLAAIALSRSDFKKASHLAEQCLTLEADNSIAHSVVGWVSLHDSRPSDALDHFRSVLDAGPLRFQCLMGLAMAAIEANQIDLGIHTLQQAEHSASSAVQRGDLCLQWARAYQRSQKNDLAFHWVEQARTWNPTCDIHEFAKEEFQYWKLLNQQTRTRDAGIELDSLKNKLDQLQAFIEQLTKLRYGSTQWPTLNALPYHPERLAVLGGDFEQPLSTNWIVTTEFGRSAAETDDANLPTGTGDWPSSPDINGWQCVPDPSSQDTPLQHCLSIDLATPSGLASVQNEATNRWMPFSVWQEIPAMPQTTYSVRYRVKCIDAAANSVQLLFGSNDSLHEASLPAGTYDWQEVTHLFWLGEMSEQELSSDFGRAQIGLRVVKPGAGKIWIDDIEIERLAEPQFSD